MLSCPSRREVMGGGGGFVAPASSAAPTASLSAPPMPVLTAARVICRECLPAGGEVVVHLEHVIDGFLDTFSAKATLLRACWDGYPARALAYLYARSSRKSRRMAVHVAAMGGHVAVLQWLVLNHRADFRDLKSGCLSPMDRAAQYGRLEAVEWLHANYDAGCSPTTMDLAAQCGQLKVVRWLQEHRSEGCTSNAMVGAASRNRFHVVKWLHEHGHHEDAQAAILKASEHGHLRVVAWLYLHGSQADALHAMLVAASSGQLNVVKWLYRNARELEADDDFLNHSTALRLASEQQHYDVVGWLLRSFAKRRYSESEREHHPRRQTKRRSEQGRARYTRRRLE
ncbi:hypothetical protein BBJ28_00009262 [Nothophytophthora sp. Chile5]|nr:hypothetical protein BBJ28_00009262 [Nothophytophthora sp. Chile5]